MIIYSAGTAAADVRHFKVWGDDGSITSRLLTFAEIKPHRKIFEAWMGRSSELFEAPKDKRLLIDSGAFSVDARGASIDLSEYCDFLESCKDEMTACVALDVIGNAENSFKNFEKMRARGLTPIPVVHQGSDLRWLERCVNETDYIGLGRISTTFSEPEKIKRWLDQCFDVLSTAWPVKVHLFGVSSLWLLERYPAYSVDSTTASISAGTGSVLTFDDGVLRRTNMVEHAQREYDGAVADGIIDPEVSQSAKESKAGVAFLERRHRNLQVERHVEQYATALWSSKGVHWNE